MHTYLFDQALLSAEAALDKSAPIPKEVVRNAVNLAVYVTFGAGTGSGVVQVEGAPSQDYGGTWAVIATVTWAAANRTHLAAIAGVHKAVRVRISTVIGGGTVDVWAVAN